MILCLHVVWFGTLRRGCSHESSPSLDFKFLVAEVVLGESVVGIGILSLLVISE